MLRELARQLTDGNITHLDRRMEVFLEQASTDDPTAVAQSFVDWLENDRFLTTSTPAPGDTDSTNGSLDLTDDQLTGRLEETFGFQSFRDGQLDSIRNVLSGNHTLLVMPTGGGKSLCYQFPSVVHDGMTLVLSPLISLMKDQVDDLRSQGISATAINSSFSTSEQIDRLEGMKAGQYDMVYVAPERLENRTFQRHLEAVEVDLLAVDEAHCISKWGYDFRPSYRHIPDAWEMVGQPTVLATTATATPRVQKDIRKQLNLPAMAINVRGFNRPNLYFQVDRVEGAYDKKQRLTEYLDGFDGEEGSAIVYVGTRDETEEVSQYIRESIGLDAHPYHGGMDRETRKQHQRDFLTDEVPVIVATNAFGMGIDKPDIRTVIHYRLPGTVESYYQEAGRAGRDGDPALCVLMYDPSDRGLQKFFIQNDAPDRDELFKLYEAIRQSPPGSPDSPLPDGRTARVSKRDLAGRTEMHDVKVQVGIRLLDEAGWVEDRGKKQGVRHLTVHGEDYDTLADQLELVQERRREKFRRLDDMVEYAGEDVECRRRYILQYFGEGEPPDVDRCCDRCDGETEEASPTEQLIVKAVAESAVSLGIHKWAMVLTGSSAQSITDNGHDELPWYGRLSGQTQASVRTVIERMVKKGRLIQEGDRRPTLGVPGSRSTATFTDVSDDGTHQADDPLSSPDPAGEESYPPF